MPEMTTPGHSSWVEHSGPNSAEAQRFYREVVGWKLGEMPMQDGSTYTSIMLEDGPIGGFPPHVEKSGAWTVYFTVTDVDAGVVRARKAGATVVAPAFDVPGVGRMATLLDPQGARFALITYESMRG